jgi:hypothetical protein
VAAVSEVVEVEERSSGFWFSSKNTFFSYMAVQFQSFLLDLLDRSCLSR